MLAELRVAIRPILRNPGFAIPAILILALGCGSTTAIFSIVYGVLLRDLPYEEPERLVALGSKLTAFGFSKTCAGAADYFDWRKRQQVFEDIALTRAVANLNLTRSGEPKVCSERDRRHPH
jgi:putative ABC transport system permease protein